MPEPFRPDEPALAAYVHIPFCKSKCSYCDFYSCPGQPPEKLAAYTAAVISEITATARIENRTKTMRLRSVFLGGGTPTIMPAEQLAAILDSLRENYGLSPDGEFTLEANPGTVTSESLGQLRRAGFNRISFGLQAAQPHLLQLLGRTHDMQDFVKSLELAKAAGFESCNADIMFGLPGQTVEDVEETVAKLLLLPIDHVSFYSLSLEEHTPLKAACDQAPGLLPEEETERLQYRRIAQILKQAGFVHYEISNAARPGRECLHNLVYWHARPYLGFGAAAHSYRRGVRRANVADIDEYIAVWTSGAVPSRLPFPGSDDLEIIDREGAMKETMILGLRLLTGVSAAEFAGRFGVSLNDVFGPVIDRLAGRGLLAVQDGRVRLTRTGLDLANQVFMAFI